MRKQILAFCQAYIKDPEKNGAAAARTAGYSEKTARTKASQLLTRVDVQKYLANFYTKQEERTEIDADWVLSQLKKVADRCMQEEPVMSGGEPTGEFKFDSGGANKALELIGKNKKMFTDKVDLEMNGRLLVKTTRKRFDGSEGDIDEPE